ncbi:MFS transporter [Curtobacterium herbarum]|uniref:MFS transporter n=1 Tax=Curtobacterium herbarum TaxID=150122 RepID=A0ABN1ZB87_9MICO|nr:MFS transporter [Curtobacterium herbarum]MBM7475378.1 MFS family permease [Curtobacterium herbarum]MCS6543294.1 MFS transporter [Curtobacterium herbarum]
MGLSWGRAVPSRWRALPPAVWLLVAARTVNRLGAFTLPFLAVVLVDDFSVPVQTAGAIVALFGVATIPSRLIGGLLSDRIGHRATIVWGLTLTAVFQLLLAAAPGVVTAAAAAVLIGLSFEIYEPPSQALVADVVEGDRERVAAYGLYSAALAVAGVLAGVLAATVGGVDLRLLFVADAVTCLGCATLVLVGLRPRRGGHEPEDRASAPPAVVRSPWLDPILIGLLVTGTGFAVLYLQLEVALPLTLRADGIQPSLVGVLFAVSALVIVLGQPLVVRGPLTRLSHFAALAIGFLVLGVGFVLNGVAADLPGLIAATAVWSLGDLVLLGHASALVAAIAPAASRVRYMSVFGISWGIAATIGPLVGTQLIAHLHVACTWWVLGLLCVPLATAQPVLAAVARRSGRVIARS